MLRILLVIFVSCLSLLRPVVAAGYRFDHYSTADGLPNNRIRNIIQDQAGYMWFTTSIGLSRYDGQMFEYFPDFSQDSLTTKAFRLRSVFEDRKGGIWSISQSGACYWIDPSRKYIYSLQDLGLVQRDRSVVDYFISSTGDVWLIQNQGLVRLYYKAGASQLSAQYFDKHLLGVDRVNFVIEDKTGAIWVGTNYGLLRFLFDAAGKEAYQLKSFFTNQKTAILKALSFRDKIYFGLDKNFMIIYDIEKESFRREFELETKVDGRIISITSNHTDHLLLGTSNGHIIYYNVVSGEFVSKAMPSLGQTSIREVIADSYGDFWVILSQRGIYRFSPTTMKIKYYALDKENRSFLGESDKQLFLEDSNRDVWIGINGGGLFKYNRDDDNFLQFKHDPNNIGTIASDVILSLYEDRSKNLWIGTSYGGLNKISLKKEKLSRIYPEENPQTVFDNYIRSTTTDLKGNIWMGSKAGKIYIYNSNKEKIGTIPDDLHATKKFPLANVYALYFDSDNNLWIGTKGYGVFVIKSILKSIDNLGSRTLEVYHFTQDDSRNSLSSDNVYCVEQDVYGQYWFGSFSAGLDLLTDPFGKPHFQTFSDINKMPGVQTGAEVRDLLFDRDNNLWVATSSGVSVLMHEDLLANKKRFITVASGDDLKYGVKDEVVYQIKQLRNGDIYLAMLDGGVKCLTYRDFLKGEFKWEHLYSELAHSSIYSLEEDGNGSIWMGTDEGLLCYNTLADVIEKYKVNNSNIPLIFSENCSCSRLSQELAFGSTNGLIILHPDSMTRDTTQYPLLFSKLEVNGSLVNSNNSDILDMPIAQQKHIELSEDQNNVTLYFSVLDYDNSQAILYKSYLEGYDSYWSKPSANYSVSYRKLPPGTYTLYVQGTNSRGVWSKNMAQLSITVYPRFWHSVVGRVLFISILLLIIFSIAYLLYRQFKTQQKVRIENAITEKRMEYYTNLSHEFKTPLSLIMSPVDEILASQKSSPFVLQKGMQIKKNATYLNRLIDQILDFRRIREGHMKLAVSKIDIIELFREIYLIFLPLSKRLGVEFDYVFDLESYYGYADSKHIEKVVYNLLSNAFRFSSAGMQVKLIVSVNESESVVSFNVIDQGPGISEEEQEKIFQRFYDSKHSSGIGLFYTKELVSLHKGTISVNNNLMGGANFQVSIPLSRKTYQETEIVDIQRGTSFTLKPINDIEAIVSENEGEHIVHSHSVDYFEKLLVVEDNEEMRGYLKASLSNKYKVYVATDGVEGLELAKKKQPSLIVSDIAMPNMDGYEMVKNLKSSFDTSHIPVFLVTAESSEEQKIFALECGADDFISKPFNMSLLKAKIDHEISQRKRLKERFERDNSVGEELNEGSIKSTFLTKVQELVQANMSNERMNVDYLVEKMGYSRTLFYKKMRSYSGYAPNEYIRIVRMKEAAKLLTTTDKTVNEISSLVGISDPNYFSKIFKKHFGESPSFYKSNN